MNWVWEIGAPPYIVTTPTECVLLVTEWWDDGVENHVKSCRYSDPAHLSKLANQILCALSYLTDIRFVHRDLSPAHLLLTSQGNMNVSGCGQCHAPNNNPNNHCRSTAKDLLEHPLKFYSHPSTNHNYYRTGEFTITQHCCSVSWASVLPA